MNSKEGLRENSRPTLLESLAVADILIKGGIIYLREFHKLSKQGVTWYPLGSLCLPIMHRLTGRNLSNDMFPFITYIGEYIRQADDLFDTGGEFPSWKEYRKGTMQTKNRLLDAVETSSLDPIKKQEMLKRFEALERKAYNGFQQKEEWESNPSFEQAYNYRLDTVGTMWEAVALWWSITTDVPEEKQEAIQKATIKTGMVSQYFDDLMDMNDDTPRDGNLVWAILNENPEEKKAMEDVLKNIENKPKIMELLAQYAPQSVNRFLKEIDTELVGIKNISPTAERLGRGIVKIALPRIVISKGGFYNKFTLPPYLQKFLAHRDLIRS